MAMMCMRCLDLTFRRQPLQRIIRFAPKNIPHPGMQLISDTIDLMTTTREIDWQLSEGMYIPQETRPTSSTSAFLLATVVSAVRNFVWFDTFYFTFQSMMPEKSLFNPLLPPFQRYALAMFLAWLAGMAICLGIDFAFDLATIFGIFVCRQHISQWPPISDNPWKASSLSQLWSKRWHQMMRVRIPHL
jgi:Membrane bound O-acyl transferase family